MGRKEDALEYHSRGRRGKLEVVPTKPLVSQLDLSLAYSPGVAEPCLEIARDEDVPLLPFHDTLEDGDRPGRMREEWTHEGDHPNEDGYRRLAEVALSLAVDGGLPAPPWARG